MNEYYVKVDDSWIHRAPIKVVLNPVLRFIQFWTNKPYVIASVTEFVDKVPNFKKFTFCRVEYK